MQGFKWEDLRYFLAVARAGNLSKAARVLGVNHSTVFRRLTSLEQSLGVRLFQRLPEGYVLTAPGEDMLSRLIEIDEEITSLDLRMRGQDHRLTGTIRFTTSDAIAQVFLTSYLPAFHHAYPDIKVDLTTSNTAVNLSRREADVALRPTRNPPEGLIGRRLGIIAWAVYGARAYLERHGTPRSVQDLAQHRLISTDESLSHIGIIRWVARHTPADAVVLRCDSVQPMFIAAVAGIGVSPLPCWMGDAAPDLVRVLPPRREDASELWLLTHRDLRYTARIRVFMDYMARALIADQRHFEGEGPAALSTPGTASA